MIKKKTRDLRQALDWEVWVDANGVKHRQNTVLDCTMGFQYRSIHSTWCVTDSPGDRPWSQAPRKMPAPATLADCLRHVNASNRAVDYVIRCRGQLLLPGRSTLNQLHHLDLESTSCVLKLQSSRDWISPNGTVEE